ncbi:MAG: hypothetical protein ACSLE6_20640 [Mycobacterium sp.]
MTIVAQLERAHTLAFADDEAAARDLLVSLMPEIERAGRDDLMLQVFAQLGEIYLTRGAHDGVAECIRRIRECIGSYETILSGSAPSQIAAQVTMSTADVTAMVGRYSVRAHFLDIGLFAARGEHDEADDALTALTRAGEDQHLERDAEYNYCVTLATVTCATALCDDDLHVRSAPLWETALRRVSELGADDAAADRLRVLAGLAYGRFCVETGRLVAAEKALRRAGARAELRGWQLASARASLERGAASWTVGDQKTTERLITQAYPVIAHYARAHDVARCWLYLGLVRLAVGALEQADECWGHAERHWRELGKPLYVHRILLQRSWISIFRGRFADAVELVTQAREHLDAAAGRSWLAYARLDYHLGTIWRADALTDLGFDGAGDPEASIAEVEARHAAALGVTTAATDTPEFRRAMAKLEQAAELKVPAALAVDSVRYLIDDVAARQRWAAIVSAPLLAGAFATAWEWENSSLIGELVEYHSARGAFDAQTLAAADTDWTSTATAATPAEDVGQLATAAAGHPLQARRALTRLGPLPPLLMNPGGAPILRHYRELASQRYGRNLTATEKPWATWP